MHGPFGSPNVQMGSFALLELPEEFFSVTPSEHERSIITVGRIWPRHLSSFEMKHLHWRLRTFLHWVVSTESKIFREQTHITIQ